ncbi:MAG: DUF4381 domain-containing protein [Halieaceae bacterium]|jgi:type II secretory pathway pseudopilin PulG|nr:DUF4381 domain-containing protein [Halieaceae bacterium]
MQTADPLAQLRDIHLPEPAGAWPPGPGWWVLGVVLILLLAALAIWLWRRRRANAWRREALAALEQAHREWQEDGDSARFLQSTNAILKRAALRQFPNYEVARLSGDAWDAFLDRQWRKQTPEQSFTSLGLARRAYSPNPELNDAAAVMTICRAWLSQLAEAPC